jgi:hypothetical protein
VFRTNVISETIWNDQDFPNISRANLIQSYVGDIDCVIRLCELGLKCLTSKGTFDDAALPIGQVHKVWQSAVSLQGMILDDAVSMDDDGIDIRKWMEMDLASLLELVLNSEMDTFMIMHRFQEYIRPLILDTNGDEWNVDQAFALDCVGEARKSRNSPVFAVKNGISFCTAIAECSLTSIRKQDRLIKETSHLIETAVSSSMEILMALSTKTIPIIDQQEVLDGLWRLYETLPSRLPEDQDNNKSLVNSLFKLLVTIDILTRWPGSSPFSIVQTLENGQSCTSDQLKEHRMDVIDVICNSFVDVLPGIDDDSDKISLL